MLLIIPSIDLQNGVSAQAVEGPAGAGAGTDPVAIARLFRIENAKSLHVTDLDGAREGHFTRFDVMERLFACVDIPIEASGGISTDEDAGRLLGLGACRVVLRPGLIETDPDAAKAILTRHGSGKVVAAIERRNPLADPLPAARAARAMGFRRLLYTEVEPVSGLRILNTAVLGSIAKETGLRLTVSGGVISLQDLRAVEALEPVGVDSVILRRAIYSNAFSCQAIWRIAEAGGYPYTAKV